MSNEAIEYLREPAWSKLLRGYQHPVGLRLRNRADYLEACALLYDLAAKLPEGKAHAAQATADELLNEAAMAWTGPCECGGAPAARRMVSDREQRLGRLDIVAYEFDLMQKSHANVSAQEVTGEGVVIEGYHIDCNGTGRVERITDAHRLRLVEALIAAGLPKKSLRYTIGADGVRILGPT